jgi:hypothetical protein
MILFSAPDGSGKFWEELFFYWTRKATKSSFLFYIKNSCDKKLETTAGLRPDKIKEIYCN